MVAMANGMSTSTAPTPPIQTSRILWYSENGREYHLFKKGKYLFPCDEDEKDRMDIYHKIFSVARGEVLHTVPLNPNLADGLQILDLGTGTGIWAIDMAEKYWQWARVKAVDLAWIQPSSIPPNLELDQMDIESPQWHGIKEDSWDLIHMRMLNGSIADWGIMYHKIFRHLKPNHGWLEHIEIDMIPRCDDGTLAVNSPLVRWTRLIMDAMEDARRPLSYNTATRSKLEYNGFVDIQEQVIQLPLNPWPIDPHLKQLGRWYNLGFTQGLEALALAPLTRITGWRVEEVQKLCHEVKQEICSMKHHIYHNL